MGSEEKQTTERIPHDIMQSLNWIATTTQIRCHLAIFYSFRIILVGNLILIYLSLLWLIYVGMLAELPLLDQVISVGIKQKHTLDTLLAV